MAPKSFRRSAPGALTVLLTGALAVAVPGSAPPGAAQELAAVAGQTTTKERLRTHDFWPRKTFESAAGHAGSAACGECHGAILASQLETPMARTLAPVAAAAPAALPAGGGDFELGAYRYRIALGPGGGDSAAPGGAGPGFTVTDGERTLAARLEWVFGAGETGFTWLWARDGAFYESRFSWFPGLGGFAATPGRLLGPPVSLEMAAGHPLPAAEAEGCFSCHATAMAAGRLDPARLTPGVTCEGCHGPGADHVALAKSGLGAGAIFDPGGLEPPAAVDFCGACHSTWWDVAVGPTTGLATVRSPGYRLAQSRCWGEGDARLTCTSCHDPHRLLVHEPAAYDGACRACHAGVGDDEDGAAGTAAAAAHPPDCPVGTERCVTCHMPKYELPALQVTSTDHRIRVVRPGEPFVE